MSTADIIKDVSFAMWFGDYYNNPSFGCGGYCLPKNIKQLPMDLMTTTGIEK